MSRGNFSSHDKGQIKLLSEFLNLRSTFNDISLCKKKKKNSLTHTHCLVSIHW